MKKMSVLALTIASLLVFSNGVRADLLSQYGVGNGNGINDTTNYNDNVALYQLFNKYFEDQLGTNFYTSSNQLFNDRGVDPYTDWTTSGSQLVGAFKVAAFGHTMSMFDSNGNYIAGVMHVEGTTNIGEQGGITDLGNQSITNIADGLNVNFRLDALWAGSPVYSWGSTPGTNDGGLGRVGDNMIHMLALDITDLYNAKYNTKNDSVYMFAWEDLHLTAAGGGSVADWDYQDFVTIMTNVKPNSSTTPEPGTMLIMGLGGIAGLVAYRRRRVAK